MTLNQFQLNLNQFHTESFLLLRREMKKEEEIDWEHDDSEFKT